MPSCAPFRAPFGSRTPFVLIQAVRRTALPRFVSVRLSSAALLGSPGEHLGRGMFEAPSGVSAPGVYAPYPLSRRGFSFLSALEFTCRLFEERVFTWGLFFWTCLEKYK